VSPKKTMATAIRVLQQLKHDPRTIALIIVVPCVLLILLRYMYNNVTSGFNSIAPMILGLIPLILMFVVTSVATLRERTSGTMERLLTLPVGKLDILFGYAAAFALLSFLQSVVVCTVTLGFLGLVVAGGTLQIVLTSILSGLLGTSLGLFVSAFANTEFQAVQFMPALIFPQLLLCGFFVPRAHMGVLLKWISDVLPLTYIIQAMQHVSVTHAWSGLLTRDLLITLGFIITSLSLGAMTLKRQV
jgi:ABC-2 type transport system permease protein